MFNVLSLSPHTRIAFLVTELAFTRQTPAKHLDALAETGFLRKPRAGTHDYDVNAALVQLFLTVAAQQTEFAP